MAEKASKTIVRHVSAARAFTTGLAADTQRIRGALTTLTNHLNVVRHDKSAAATKLAAVEAACLHLRTIERLAETWRETYRDLRRSLRRVRFHMKRHQGRNR
jgi:hypothetical protein